MQQPGTFTNFAEVLKNIHYPATDISHFSEPTTNERFTLGRAQRDSPRIF